jgi:beta-N-acetylhexosaminidase
VDDEHIRGADRRRVLKNALVLGAAAPVVGVLPGTRAPAVRAQASAVRAQASAVRARALSSAQLAGQRVVYSYPGLTVPSALLAAISAGRAAGVIFFGANISSDAQIASVIGQLVQAQRQSPVSSPLLLMTDQEGGLVRRLPGAPAPSEKQIGESANPAAAASQAGTGAGQNLAGVGMNVNLAPVLDVYYESGNFIDEYQRSYSSRRRW